MSKPTDDHKKPDKLYVRGDSLTSHVGDDLRQRLWSIKKLADLEDYELMAELESLFATQTAQLKERVLALLVDETPPMYYKKRVPTAQSPEAFRKFYQNKLRAELRAFIEKLWSEL